jgi:hypothetical protein
MTGLRKVSVIYPDLFVDFLSEEPVINANYRDARAKSQMAVSKYSSPTCDPLEQIADIMQMQCVFPTTGGGDSALQLSLFCSIDGPICRHGEAASDLRLGQLDIPIR